MRRLDADAISWTTLLGQWMDFARRSVALPDDADGRRWRESITPIINLQAVTFALGDLVRVEPADRPHARDKASVIIRENAAALEAAWHGEAMPVAVAETIDDARRALADALYIGATELIWPGDGVLIMPNVEPDLSAGGTLAVMQPGTIVMPGEPVAWWIERDERGLPDQLAECEPSEAIRPRQVYRQMDEHGRIARDLIAPITEEMPAGLPLLVPLLEEGRAVGRFTLDPNEWESQQRAAMEGDQIEVVEWTSDEVAD